MTFKSPLEMGFFCALYLCDHILESDTTALQSYCLMYETNKKCLSDFQFTDQQLEQV